MKRVLLIALIIMLMLLLAACAASPSVPGNASKETSAPTELLTEAPTEIPTEEPTEAPTGEPTVEPTSEPLSEEDAAMLDEAWEIASRVCDILGIELDRNLYDISRQQEKNGRITVIFFDSPEGGMLLDIPFTIEENGERSTSIGNCMLDPELHDIDEAKWEADGEGLRPESFTVTADQLKKAGRGATLRDAMEYAAEAYAVLFTELPEGNYFRCKTALPIEYISYGEADETTVKFVFIPDHAGEFTIQFGDILSAHLYESAEHSEYDGAITSMIDFSASDNGDGSYTVTVYPY